MTVYDLNTGKKVTLNGYEMMCRIIRNEVGGHYISGAYKGQTIFNKETIKAFTVAAYSYISYCKKKGILPKVGLNKDVSQSLRNYVAEVDGQVCYYNKQPICAVYTASTGGTTLSSLHSWGTNNPYLVSVESKYDSVCKQYHSVYKISKNEMKNILQSQTGITLSNNPENWLVVGSTVDGNYVNSLIIDGNSTCYIKGKQRTITGTYFRNNIMNYKLKSPNFTVKYSDGYFIFDIYGYGHGVGLSAEGAEGYVKYENWDYKQILTHYYTGVIIS